MGKIFLFIFFISFVGFIACTHTTPALPNARIRIINLSPNSPPLSLQVNGSSIAPVFDSLPYLDTTTNFQIGAGTYSMNFLQTDTLNYYKQDTVITTMDSITFDTTYIATDTISYSIDSAFTVVNPTISVQSGMAYSLFLIDTIRALQSAFIPDDLSSPGAGSVKLRFFNFCINSSAVDLAQTGGSVLFNNRTFNDVSSTPSYAGFSTLQAGTYNFELRVAGTSTVIATLPQLTLSGGRIYTLYAKGILTYTGIQAPGIGIIANQ